MRRLTCEIDNHWLPAAVPLSENLLFKSTEAEWSESEIADGIEGVRSELRRATLGLTAAVGPGLRRLMALVEAQPYFDKTYPQHWR